MADRFFGKVPLALPLSEDLGAALVKDAQSATDENALANVEQRTSTADEEGAKEGHAGANARACGYGAQATYDRVVGIHPCDAEDVVSLSVTKRSGESCERTGC